MIKDYYLLLTGAYNNAGDFLIVDRAVKLLETIRPDREIKLFSRNEELTGDALAVANGAKAILICGGPAVRSNIWPQIVSLSANLDDIKVPIILFGIGWKDSVGSWSRAFSFKFSDQTKQLLDKVASSGFSSSVRDFHAYNILKENGMRNLILTGCPALYDAGSNVSSKSMLPLAKDDGMIAVSVGVSYLTSEIGLLQCEDFLDRVTRHIDPSRLLVVFHHSINSQTLISSYPKTSPHIKHFDRTERILHKLAALKIPYADISGGLENFASVYGNCSAHIGFRVHGHVLAVSSNKPSVLIAEDNRALSFKDMISGAIFDGNISADKPRKLSRTFSKFFPIGRATSMFTEEDNLRIQNTNELAIRTLLDEISGRTKFTEVSTSAIASWKSKMNEFLLQLP